MDLEGAIFPLGIFYFFFLLRQLILALLYLFYKLRCRYIKIHDFTLDDHIYSYIRAFIHFHS